MSREPLNMHQVSFSGGVTSTAGGTGTSAKSCRNLAASAKVPFISSPASLSVWVGCTSRCHIKDAYTIGRIGRIVSDATVIARAKFILVCLYSNRTGPLR